jgi:Protein of unknown function (DUF4232)
MHTLRTTLNHALLGTAMLAVAVGASAAAATPRSAPAACQYGQLRVMLGSATGATGHILAPIIFVNRSANACSLRGYPGVSSVAGNDGHQVGAPAGWAPGRVRTVVLAANGGRTRALFDQSNPDFYNPATCRPVNARGYRVYAPNQRLAFYLPAAHHACSNRGLVTSRVLPVAYRPA